MTKNNVLIADYCDNAIENFSTFAYAKILESKYNLECFYQNKPNLREKFEKQMSCFNMDFKYLSVKSVKDIASKSYFFDKFKFSKDKIFKKCIKENRFLSKEYFDIEDIGFLSNEIINKFKFNDKSFLKDYDIFDKIKNSNSIGLYISEKDKLSESDFIFLNNALNRLNKYIKKPKLFIFTKNNDFKIDTFLEYKILNISDWREVYYFLSNCKHHIILDNKNSYSLNFWSSIVLQETYSYCVYKKNKVKTNMRLSKNWLAVE